MNATPRPQDAGPAADDQPPVGPPDAGTLLESVADGVVVLRPAATGLVLDWASRRFLDLARLPRLVPGQRPDFLYSVADNRALAEQPPDVEFPPALRLAIRRGDVPICLVDVACRRLGDGRHVLTCTRMAGGGLADLSPPNPAFDDGLRVGRVNATAAEALRDARESLRLAVEGAHIGFFEYDVALDRFHATDQYYEMLGFDPAAERALGPHVLWSRVHPEDVTHVREQLARLVADPASRSDIELRLATGRGDWLWILGRARVVATDADGRGRVIAGIALDVDRRKRAERGLAQSEARYRTLAAITPGILHESELDAQGRFVVRWASEGLTRLLGWTVDELNARGGWTSINHPSERAAATERRDRVFAGAQTHTEIRLLTKSGTYVWMSSFACALHDPDDGRASRMMGALYDVTHLKETEAALRRSEQRHRTVSELMSGVVYEAEIDADGEPQVSWFAGRPDDAFGWTAADLTRDRWRTIHHPDDLPLVEARLRRLLDGHDSVGESRVIARDGSVRWGRFLSRPVVDPATGRVTGLVGALEDITARKLADEQLRESEFRYRNVTELTPGFVYEARFRDERSWTLEWVGPGFETVYGCTADRFRELGLAHFYGPEQVELMRERILRARSGCDVHAEIPIRNVDGEPRWIRLTVRPVRDADGEYRRVIGIVEDISARKAAEQQLQASAARLAESEERFRLAAEAFNGIIYDYDARTGVVNRSRGVREVLGYEADALPPTAAAWRALVHPEDLERLRREGWMPATESASLQASYRVRHADGHWVDVWDRSLTVRDDDGRIVRVVGCAVDVTNERRFERMLAEAEAAAHVGSWEIDPRGPRLLWSPETYRIHDLEPGQIEPTVETALAFYVPESRAAITDAVDRGLRTGAPWELDLEVLTAKGRRKWVRASGHAEVVEGEVVRVYGAFLDIDTLKRAQLRLQQHGDWLRMSMEASNLAAWRWYPARDEAVIEFRGGAMAATVERPSLAGWLRVIDEAHRERVERALQRTAADGTPTHEDYTVRDARGGSRWLVTRAIRGEDPQGVVVIGTTQDITDRREAEERVRSSEQLLRSVAENSPDFITVIGHDWRIRFVNRGIDGMPPDALVGRDAREFSIGGPETLERHLARVFATGEPVQYEVAGTRDDGSVRHYQQRAGAIRDGEAVVGAIVHTTDVTARRIAERGLRTQASVLATMLEGVVVLDAAATIRLTNPAFDRMFGHDPGALEGRAFADLLGADGALPADGAGAFEFAGRRADGAGFDAAAIASRLELAGETYTVCVVQDVTERRALERELLEIANREQRRIGSDLHDGLGQELTGVALMLRGLASRVQRGQAATAEDLDELVTLVNGAIESTRALARGLSPIELERGGLVYALRALAHRARDLYGVDVRFRSRVWPELTLDAAATTHLYRIAQEALTNAARHAQATQVTVSLGVRGNAVSLTVVDDGRGIPDGVGAGMGLRIMRYRAQMMGGELSIGPAVPRGTRVACRVRQPDGAPPTGAGA